jgi:uncharacterized membrane protein
MQWINQFSALLLLVLPLMGFILILLTRNRYPAARWPLLALSVCGTLLVLIFLSRFQTGAAGASATEVESILNESILGRPVFLELYSDY